MKLPAPKSTLPKLIVIAAPSGTGKSTLCTRLLREHANVLALSVSTTSRAPRGNEKHGVEYFFVSANSFQEKIARNEFAEWASVHGNFYGTEKAVIEKFWSEEKSVLLDIDVQGAESLRKIYPDRVICIFLTPPSMEELERRLRGRNTENEEEIQKRLKHASHELARKHEFDVVIVNDDLERTYSSIKEQIWPKRQ